jgi:hypothetical protein
MAGEGKGLIGSIAVHAGILCAIVGFSWFASRHGGESVQAVDPLLVDLNGIPGRRAGQVGRAEGVAKGQENGTKLGVPIVRIKKLDLEKIEQEREKAERAEQSAQNSASPKTLAKAGTKSGPSSNGKTSLNDYLNSKGGKAGSGRSGGIGGVSVKQGRSYGTGDNGGEGGSASEQQAYAGEVLARFRTVWGEVVAAEGAGSSGSCGVTLAIDASGTVTFSGWLTRPKDPHMVDLVRRACSQIGNCGKPPGGKSFKIDFPKVSLSEG